MNSGVNRWTPPVDGDVIDVHAALGEELLNIAIGQAVPQIPPDGDLDHLTRESEPCKRRNQARGSHRAILASTAIRQRNSAVTGERPMTDRSVVEP
jgi:hypothetical protein